MTTHSPPPHETRLDLGDIYGLLMEITYRPGWEIIASRIDGQPYISILAYVENSYDPGELVPLRIHSPLPPLSTPDDFYEWLSWRLQQIEIHESQEWFKISGKPYRDPHRPM